MAAMEQREGYVPCGPEGSFCADVGMLQRGRFWHSSRKNFATIADLLTMTEAVKESLPL